VRAVNLIPAEERRGAGGIAGRSGGVVYVVPGGLALVVALGVVYASAVHSVATHTGELNAVNQQVAAVTAQTAALQPYVQIASISEQKVAQVATLAQERFNWPAAMAQLALALPNDVTLTSVSAAAGAASATSPGGTAQAPVSGGGASFALTGCANSQGEVPSLLTQLSTVPGVSNVTLTDTAVSPALRYHGSSTRLSHGGSVRGDEPVAGTCPKVTWTVGLDYASSYTVPKVRLPQGSSSGAQTVSTASGASSIVQTSSQVKP
jgi:Tfp pilus assembly protein PilN